MSGLPRRALYALFFLSGLSGLVYQVIWVRAFGNIFGNTVHSASLVIAVFMCGLGVGAYGVGVWADRHAATQPRRLLRLYGYSEFTIALLALIVSLVLPQLGALSSAVSSYQTDLLGWHRLSFGSHVARVALAVVLLGPITLVMGGTLTLLIRYRVAGDDLGSAGREIGALYGINTVGAALGCFLTDFAFVPWFGVAATQEVAVVLNLIAAVAALRLSRRAPERSAIVAAPSPAGAGGSVLAAMTASLFFSGLAAMGVELLWLRHLGCILGGFRAVFSLMLALILCGFWVGAIVGGAMSLRVRRPALLYLGAQAAFAVATLYGLTRADATTFLAEIEASKQPFLTASAWGAQWLQLRLNLGVMVPEVLLPAVFMGVAYPLANAVVQSVAGDVGRRAGVLYLGNTVGAVIGSLVTGFLLLPRSGMQLTAQWLTGGAAIGLVCAFGALALDRRRPLDRGTAAVFALSLACVVAALGWWSRQPADAMIGRTLPPLAPRGAGERLLTVSEGLNEIVSISEMPDGARILFTDGHPMAGTTRPAQRYMRAFAHIPLLAAANPERALVICFGVGNTVHAASLHQRVRRLELVDLSDNILSHAGSFAATNGGVISDPRLSIFVNDGRQHLRMQPEQSYDLITMEPPPIAMAGVAALYSREFYALARSRLKPGGYVTQWLPVYQVPGDATLAMIRAFVDVFPASVLLSGDRSELIMMGTTDATLTVDPAHIAARLVESPAVAADLSRIDLGNLTELLGTFVASAATLTRTTQDFAPVTDDEPMLEHLAYSQLVGIDTWVPGQIFDVTDVDRFCPACRTYPGLEQLPSYLAVLARVYRDPQFLEQAKYGKTTNPGFGLNAEERATVASSRYLRDVLGVGRAVSGGGQ